MVMHANNVPVFSEGDSYATMAGLEMEERQVGFALAGFCRELCTDCRLEDRLCLG